MHTSYVHKIRGYTQFATKFTLFASFFGVVFITKEKKYIRLMFQLMAAIDIFIDSETVFAEPKEKRFALIKKCSITGDWSQSPPSIALRMHMLQNLGLVRDLSLINTQVLQILDEEVRMRNAETFKEFSRSRKAQNKLASEIIFASLIETNPSANLKRLSEYTATFAIVGGFVDTLFDMSLDYREKNIRIQPSLSFRAHIFKEMVFASKSCVSICLQQPKIFFYLLQDIGSIYKSWFIRTFGLT